MQYEVFLFSFNLFFKCARAIATMQQCNNTNNDQLRCNPPSGTIFAKQTGDSEGLSRDRSLSGRKARPRQGLQRWTLH